MSFFRQAWGGNAGNLPLIQWTRNAGPPPPSGQPSTRPVWAVNAGNLPFVQWTRSVGTPGISGPSPRPVWLVNTGNLPLIRWTLGGGPFPTAGFTATGQLTALFTAPPVGVSFTDAGKIIAAFRGNFGPVIFTDAGKIIATFDGLSPISSEGFTAPGNLVAQFQTTVLTGWSNEGMLTANFLPRVGQGSGCITGGTPSVKPPNAAH